MSRVEFERTSEPGIGELGWSTVPRFEPVPIHGVRPVIMYHYGERAHLHLWRITVAGIDLEIEAAASDVAVMANHRVAYERIQAALDYLRWEQSQLILAASCAG